MSKYNILPKAKATNWGELPSWLKYYLPFLGIIIFLFGFYMDLEILKNISEFIIYLMGCLVFLHYTHETRKKTLKKSLIIGLISFGIISLIIIYILASK